MKKKAEKNTIKPAKRVLGPADARGLNIRYSIVILLVTLIAGFVAFSGGAGFFRDTQSFFLLGLLALAVFTLSVGAPVRISVAHTALALLIAVYLASSVRSVWWPESLLETGLLIGYLALFFLGANVVGGNRKRLALHALVLVGLTVSAIALYQYAAGFEGQIAALVGHGQAEQARQLAVMSANVFGNFPTANGFAGWLILLIPAGLGLAMFERDWRIRAWLGIATGIMATALYLTGSRAGMLALLIGVAVAFVFWAVRFERGRTVILSGSLGLLVVSLGLIGFFFRFRPDTFMVAFSGRIELWRAALRMAFDNPWLGVGPFGFGTAMMKYQIGSTYSRYAHNSYLQAAAETGWPGLLVLLIVIGLVMTIAWRRYRAADQTSSWLLLGLIGGLTAVIVHNAVDYTWHLPAVALAFWWVAGLAVADDKGAATTAAAAGLGRSMVVVILILAAVPVVLLSNSQSAALAARTGYEHYLDVHGVSFGGTELDKKRDDEGDRDDDSEGHDVAQEVQDVRSNYERSLRLFPYDSNTFDSYAGMVLQEGGAGGYLNEAAALERKAISFRPDWPHYHLRLAQILEAASEKQAAENAYDRAAALGKKDQKFNVELGFFLVRSARAADALTKFESAVALEKQYAPNLNAERLATARGDLANPMREIGRAYFGAAQSLLKLEKSERALKMLAQAERILGPTPDVMIVRGLIWERRGVYGKAVRDYRRAAYPESIGGAGAPQTLVAGAKPNPGGLLRLALALEKAGRKSEALSEARVLLGIAPQNQEARGIVRRLGQRK